MSPSPNKPAYFYTQSGVIPYRERAPGKIEVLLVNSRGGRRMVVPKGICERHLSPSESALKEAWEEAGITGQVTRTMGSYRYNKWGGRCKVEVFAMRVDMEADDWPESDVRKRQWCKPRKAAALVHEPELADMILAFADEA